MMVYDVMDFFYCIYIYICKIIEEYEPYLFICLSIFLYLASYRTIYTKIGYHTVHIQYWVYQ